MKHTTKKISMEVSYSFKLFFSYYISKLIVFSEYYTVYNKCTYCFNLLFKHILVLHNGFIFFMIMFLLEFKFYLQVFNFFLYKLYCFILLILAYKLQKH